MVVRGVDTKTCSECGLPKSIEEFRRTRHPNGRRRECLTCEQNKTNARQRVKWKHDPLWRVARTLKNEARAATPQAKRKRKEWRGHPEMQVKIRMAASKRTPAQRMYSQAKTRAKKKNLAFDITLEDVVVPKVCPVLGIPIEPGRGKHHDGSPSLDRSDPLRGYVKGNVAVISHRANLLKSNGTAEEHLRIATWIQSNTSRTPGA